MDKDLEKLLNYYKRGLIVLSKLTEEDVKKNDDKDYEDFVHGVAKRHLEIGEEMEKKINQKLNIDKEADLDKVIKEFEE